MLLAVLSLVKMTGDGRPKLKVQCPSAPDRLPPVANTTTIATYTAASATNAATNNTSI